MKNTWLHRFISTLTIIILIIVGLKLISDIQTLLSQAELSGSQNSFYILAAVGIISGLVLYVLSLQRPVKEVVHERIIEKEVETRQTEESTVETTEETIDLDEITHNINDLLPDPKTFNTAENYTEKLLSNVAKTHEFVQAVFFLLDPSDKFFKAKGKYAYHLEEPPKDFKSGETIPGQVAKNKEQIILDDVPEGYIKVISGLGNTNPRYLLISPVIRDEECIAVIELASFREINKKTKILISKLSETLADKIVEFIKA